MDKRSKTIQTISTLGLSLWFLFVSTTSALAANASAQQNTTNNLILTNPALINTVIKNNPQVLQQVAIGTAFPNPGTPIRIHSRYKQGKYLNMEPLRLAIGHIQPGWASAIWKLVPTGYQNYFRIENQWKANKPVIHLEHGTPKVTPAPMGWHSSHWRFVPVKTNKGLAFRIQNRWRPDAFLHNEWGLVENHNVGEGAWSGHWYIEPATKQVVNPQNFSLDYFKLASYNVYFTANAPDAPNGDDRQDRAAKISQLKFLYDNDVMVVNELYGRHIRDSVNPNKILLKGLENYFPYQTETSVQHGIAVLSKWPIIQQNRIDYDELCGMDAGLVGAKLLSQKAFIHTKIRYWNNMIVNVIGTHMQSEDDGCGNARPGYAHGYPERRQGFSQIRRYIQTRIPRGEPVIVAGDLNVIKDSPEYREVMRTNPFGSPGFDGHPFSWDTKNNPIMKPAYRAQRQQTLDYAFWINNRPKPRNWHNRVVRMDNLSDHYPILGLSK